MVYGKKFGFVIEKKEFKFLFGRVVVLGVVGDKDIKDVLGFKLGSLKKIFIVKVNICDKVLFRNSCWFEVCYVV